MFDTMFYLARSTLPLPFALTPNTTPARSLLRSYPHADTRIAIELCSTPSLYHAGLTVATVSAGILKLYLPATDSFRRYHYDPHHDRWTLRLFLPSLAHVEQIEAPGLNALFAHMSLAMHSICWNVLPSYFTIGEGIKFYRALQLLHLYDAAYSLGRHIRDMMLTHALTSYDVRCIWHATRHTDEWRGWVDAVMCNLTYFGVWEWDEGQAAVEASKISEFLQEEMDDMTEEEQEHVAGVMQGHWNLFYDGVEGLWNLYCGEGHLGTAWFGSGA